MWNKERAHPGAPRPLSLHAASPMEGSFLKWDRETSTFQCPCHDGSFDRKGNVLGGPPKRPLPQFPAEVRADEIVVHT